MSDVIIALNRVNDAIFVSLVNTTVQITILVPMIALLIRLFRIKSATTRYSLWLFVLFAIIALPLITPFIPQIDVAQFRSRRTTGNRPDDPMRLGVGGGEAGELSENGCSLPPVGTAKVQPNRGADVFLINPVSIAYFIWCAGAVFMFCMITFAYRKLRKLGRTSPDVKDPMTIETLSLLKRRIGVRRSVALRASPEVYTPMSIGFLSPVIIIPNSIIDDSSSEQLEMILTHELAHIRRNDYLVNLLQNMMRVVFFFHPLFHLMNRNLTKECEHICDDWVILMTSHRSRYAECLIDMLERVVSNPVNIPVTLAMAERKQDIPGRIDMIVDKSRRICTNVPKKALLALLLIGCLCLPVIGGFGLVRFARSAPTSGKAQIAFGSDMDGNFDIFVMDVDGSNPRSLTNHPAIDAYPSWSPDGQRIAFISFRDGDDEVYIMDADGGNQRNLTNNLARDTRPSWSPDGRSIAFQSDRDGNFEIYVMDADGKNQRGLTNNSAFDGSPQWSPDGKMIVFYSGRDGNAEIYAMDADGKNVRRLTNHPEMDGNPSWSPDGKRIAFDSYRDGNFEIYVMDADGKNPSNLTNNPNHDQVANWSPDGQKIIFSSFLHAINWEIYIIDADGEHLRRLTNDPASDQNPVWFDPAFVYSVSSSGKLRSTWGKIRSLVRPE